MSIVGLIIAVALLFMIGYLLWLACGYIGDPKIQKGVRVVVLLLGAALLLAMFFGEVRVPSFGP